jgi:YVTN family beta-propeller protein
MSSERSTVTQGLQTMQRGLRTVALQAALAAVAAWLACVPALAQNAYVPNLADHTVSVIDTATGTVTATIDLAEADPGLFPVGVAVNGSGTRVYVTNACDDGLAVEVGIDDPTPCEVGTTGTISVIDTATNTVIATISDPYEPLGVAVSPDGSRVYVADACTSDCLGSGSGSSAVSVIDTATNTVIGAIALPDAALSSGIVVSQDGSKLYVASAIGPLNVNDDGIVWVIDTATQTVITTIDTTLPYADGLVLNPTRPRLYVDSVVGYIAVIDTTTNTVINDSSTHSDYFAGGFGVAMKPDGTRLYLFGELTSTPQSGMAVIDTTDDALNLVTLAPSDELLYPVGLTVHPDGSRLYATNFIGQSSVDNKVFVLDTSTNTFSSPITVGTGPTGFGQFIAPGSCSGSVSLSAYLGGATPTPAAGGTYTWTVEFVVHACQAVSNLKVQGGTNGWTNPASVGTPSIGTASTKMNNKNQVITWNVPSLAAGQTAALTLTIQGSIKPHTQSGTVLGLTGAWAAGAATAGPVNVTVQ